MQIPQNEFACKFQGTLQMGQKVIIRSGGIFVCVQKPSQHFLQIFRSLRMFKIVLRDSSLYPKQLPLFCLLWLISASAKRIGYISNLCSMICCMSSKTAVVNIEAFRHLIMSQQGRRKTKHLLDFQARNQFGTPGGEKSFLRGDSVLNYIQWFENTSNTIFLWGRNFSRGGFAPSWVRTCGLL